MPTEETTVEADGEADAEEDTPTPIQASLCG